MSYEQMIFLVVVMSLGLLLAWSEWLNHQDRREGRAAMERMASLGFDSQELTALINQTVPIVVLQDIRAYSDVMSNLTKMLEAALAREKRHD